MRCYAQVNKSKQSTPPLDRVLIIPSYLAEWLFEISNVLPRIGSIFLSLDDGHGLVICARVLLVRIFIQNRRPEEGSAPFGHDGLFRRQSFNRRIYTQVILSEKPKTKMVPCTTHTNPSNQLRGRHVQHSTWEIEFRHPLRRHWGTLNRKKFRCALAGYVFFEIIANSAELRCVLTKDGHYPNSLSSLQVEFNVIMVLLFGIVMNVSKRLRTVTRGLNKEV
jgi:hypothetical protein